MSNFIRTLDGVVYNSEELYKAALNERSAKYNDRLKAVKNQEDFDALMKLCRADPDVPYLMMKRTRRHPYSFSPLPWDASVAHYLLDDGFSTRRCSWSNLWKHIQFVH